MAEHTQTILRFLAEMGLTVVEGDIPEDTFLRGIAVIDGKMVIDLERLTYPGDLLHEAGHLAQLCESERRCWSGDFTGAGGYELGAIAWSYAACAHLGLPVEILFHEEGYKGDAEWFREQFSSGAGIGVPMLEWKSMASSKGESAYPVMQSWLCPLT